MQSIYNYDLIWFQTNITSRNIEEIYDKDILVRA